MCEPGVSPDSYSNKRAVRADSREVNAPGSLFS